MAMVKDLNKRTEAIMDKLAVIPENTPEVVAYLHYLDVCGKDIEQLITEVDFAYQCYLLMAEYDIFVDEMEKESYMGVFIFISSNCNSCSKFQTRILKYHRTFFFFYIFENLKFVPRPKFMKPNLQHST